MFFQFTCTNCSKSLKVRDENVGQRVRCPFCQKTMIVTAPEENQSVAPQSLESGSSSILTESSPESAIQPVSIDFNVQTRSSSASVSSFLTGIVSVVLTVLFFGALLALPDNLAPAILLERGPIPYGLVFILIWSYVILLAKYRNLSIQKESLLFDLLPTEISNRITLKSVSFFTQHIRNLPARTKNSFLVNRVIRGLEHFQVLHRNSEVANRLASQSEIDALVVDASYTLLRAFIWALPILGFIGTVLGIGNAIGDLSGTLAEITQIDQLKTSLLAISDGLRTAFDTTLLSLLMSLMVMFPTSALQKSEDELLNTVDEYCNEIFLKRIYDGDRSQSSSDMFSDKKAVHETINRAMANHHSELQTWNKKLESIAESLSKKIAENWKVIDKEIRTEHHQNIDRLEKVVISMQEQQKLSIESINNLSRSINGQNVSEASEKRRVQLDNEMAGIVSSFGTTLKKVGNQTESLQLKISSHLENSSSQLGLHFQQVQDELTSLNQTLENLQNKQIIIEDNAGNEGEQKKRKGLFK